MTEEFMKGSDPFDHDAKIDAQQDFKDFESELDADWELREEAKEAKVDAMVEACLAEWRIDLSGFTEIERNCFRQFVKMGVCYGLDHK